MRSKFALLVVGFTVFALLLGCGPSNRMTREEVIHQQASRITPPMKQISQYTQFKLAGMEMAESVLGDEKKIVAAQDLEAKLNTRLSPLLASWNGQGAVSGNQGTLIIQPVLQSLKIVSAGARFWVGGMAGDSNIDMDLVLVEEATNQSIGSARIQRSASGISGGWSVGATDRALPDFIVDIAYQYLIQNYSPPK